jgi:hypothetical protein
VPQRLLPLLPRIAPFSEQLLGPPATLLKLLLEETLLLSGGVQALLECLQRAGMGC